MVESRFDGRLPSSPEILATLPGIGRYTASAIAAFAFNQPTVFIETNIRSVFIECFFHEGSEVTDAQLLPLVEETLDRANPKDWYNALLDYGALLKKRGNAGSRSAHYRKQGGFRGSNREMRGLLIRLVLKHSPISKNDLLEIARRDPSRLSRTLQDLEREGFVTITGEIVSIA
jgi:A/G-specific adenine glycosylase